MKEDAQPENNVYLNHIEQNDWNDLQAYHIEHKQAWRNLALIAICCLTLVSLVAMYMVNQDKHKTLIFEKDSNGNITTLGIATQTFKVDNKMIAHQLVNFVMALREVPLETTLRRRNIDLVHKMIDPKIQATIDQMIINQYKAANNNQIIVTVTQVKPLQGSNSWEINWNEMQTTNGTTNSQAIVKNFSSTINFKLLDNIDPQIQIVNPIGLFVSYIHPTQDINSQGL